MKLIQSKLFNSVQNTMLVIIAFCLCLIVVKLYTPIASAEVAGMDAYDLRTDSDFKKAVKKVVSRGCYVDGDSIYC